MPKAVTITIEGEPTIYNDRGSVFVEVYDVKRWRMLACGEVTLFKQADGRWSSFSGRSPRVQGEDNFSPRLRDFLYRDDVDRCYLYEVLDLAEKTLKEHEAEDKKS
jgi:hypothetical protein